MIKKLLALLIVAATFGFANTAPENTLPSSVYFQDSIKAEQQAARRFVQLRRFRKGRLLYVHEVGYIQL